jgi:thiamine-phosphate pyrophosphorylase
MIGNTLRTMLRYAITNRSLYDGTETYRRESLVREARRWAAEGIDFIQVREKDLNAGELVILTHQIVAAVRDTNAVTRVLVNSRLDIAIPAGAHGVHLTSAPGELTPAQVRQLFPTAVVSISCHTLQEVRRAKGMGAEIILFGPVFGKRANGVEVMRGNGLGALRDASSIAEVFALGSVTPGDIASCSRAGAIGTAGIRLYSIQAT